MRLLSPAIAAALLALGAPALAGVDDAAHKKCLEARDYKGCVELMTSTGKSPSKDEGQSENIDSTKGEELLTSGKCKLNEYIFNQPIPNSDDDNRVHMSFNEKADLCLLLSQANTNSAFNEVLLAHGISPQSYRSVLSANAAREEEARREKLLPEYEICGRPPADPGVSSPDAALEADEYSDCLNKHRELKVGARNPNAKSMRYGKNGMEYGQRTNDCPVGTSMITIDNRWNFLFFRGGKVKEIGCMSPQQLANFNAQIELNNREASRRIWRDAVNNINADRRNQQLIDAVNQPVYCNTNSTTTGSIYGSGYGSADLYGSTSSSTSCY